MRLSSKLDIGMSVWDLVCGKGVIILLDTSEDYPITCEFADGEERTYTADYKYYESDPNQMLYFSEPVIQAALHPQYNPVKGDVVCRKNLVSGNKSYHIVLSVTKDVIRLSTDLSNGDYFIINMEEDGKEFELIEMQETNG